MVAAGVGFTLMSDLGRAFLPSTGVDVLELTRPLQRQLLLAHADSSVRRPAVAAFLESAARIAGRR